MSRKLVFHNCTVELTLPSVEMVDVEVCARSPKVVLCARECVDDVVVRFDDRVVTIKRLLIQQLIGQALPIIEDGMVVQFTSEELPNPDLVLSALAEPQRS